MNCAESLLAVAVGFVAAYLIHERLLTKKYIYKIGDEIPGSKDVPFRIERITVTTTQASAHPDAKIHVKTGPDTY